LDADTCVRLCEAFSRHQEHDLVEKFANAARKRWPDQPIFVYHAVAARAGKKKGRIQSEKDEDDLENAKDRARQRRDMRLVTRIDELFETDDPMPDFDDLGLPDVRGLPALPMGPLNARQMREIIQMSTKLDGGKSFLNNARQNLGDALMKQVERECAGDRKLYLSRIIDLVVAELVGAVAQLPAFVPAQINQPKTPVTMPLPGQKNLFNE
jgi:hypothetical protein